MGSAEFKTGCVQLWGDQWRPEAVKAFGVNDSTIDRWANGQVKVHPSAAKLLEALLEAAVRRESDRERVRRYRRSRKGGPVEA